MQPRVIALLCFTAIVCVAMACVTVLVVRGIVPWPALAATVTAVLLWAARSPFLPILEQAAVTKVTEIVKTETSGSPAPATPGAPPLPPGAA